MFTDYFTLAEFREFSRDLTSPFKFEDEDIGPAQSQVILQLERWAKTSWANATPAAIQTGYWPDGAGTYNFKDVGAGIWVPGDVGRQIRIDDGGVQGGSLIATITVWQAANWVVLDTPLGIPQSQVNYWMGNADGTGLGVREHTEVFDAGGIKLLLPHVGVREALVTVGGQLVEPDSGFYLYPDTGVVLFGTPTVFAPQAIQVVYQVGDVGETTTVSPVKEACMAATKTLMQWNNGGSMIPPGTTQYITENTTILLDQSGMAKDPWSWDGNASEQLQSYWQRPGVLGMV